MNKMINEREYVADESFESEASSDNDDQLNKRDFSNRHLAKLAANLLDDWVFILLELDLQLNEIKQIENFFPRDVRRQAIEGLILWQRRSQSPIEDLSKACREYKREDMIDLIRKIQGSSENSNKRKRCKLCTSNQFIETKKSRTTISQKRNNIPNICEDIETVSKGNISLPNYRELFDWQWVHVHRQTDETHETDDENELSIQQNPIINLNVSSGKSGMHGRGG
ncbi:Hypothetical predicted protein [Mytilus galloprovincialis]|uniref:Death domain-containing protein n=1 Tax=Mytilus galloprovincialis TaxID=29158 RepID=A0A8B6FS87_MYTGA|nr:Hypothetical predicted protein [Mytilus galloprovincialis]